MLFKKRKPNHLYRIRYTQSFNIDNRDSNNIKTTIEYNDCVEMYIAALSISEAVSKMFQRISNHMVFIRDIEEVAIIS